MKETLERRWELEQIPKRIIKAFFSIDRKKFMHSKLKKHAYEDRAFPINHGQTISQPTTIVHMLTLLNPQKNDKVLEIGAGSGFNAAILSKLCKQVYTIELIPELAKKAKNSLKEIKNIKVITGNGYKGYKKEAPYDKIMVTAGATEIPKALKEQLKEHGTLVIPLGQFPQIMKKCIKEKDKLHCTEHGEYLFVEFKKA